MNFRSRNYKDKGEYRFTQIDNEALDDPRLSNAAAGLLARLLRKPDDWRVMITQIASCSPDTIYATRAAMHELIEFGYARQITRHDRATGRFAGGDYVIFESSKLGLSFQEIEDEAEKRLSSAYRITACGFTAYGDSHTTKDCSESKTEGRKSPCPYGHGHGEAVAIADSGPVCASLASTFSPCAIDAGGSGPRERTDAEWDAIYEQYQEKLAKEEMAEQSTQGDSSPSTSHQTKGEGEKTPPRAKDGAEEAVQPTLKLDSEDSRGADKKFPWVQVWHVFRRILPEIPMPSKGERRDDVMRRLWLANGKTITPFEQLAAKVAASDFLMARGVFAGPEGGASQRGRPVAWGWVFGKDQNRGCYRYERIMEGAYDNERMEKIRKDSEERKAKAATKTTKCVNLMGTIVFVNLAEQLNGKPRYTQYGMDGSLPKIDDEARWVRTE